MPKNESSSKDTTSTLLSKTHSAEMLNKQSPSHCMQHSHQLQMDSKCSNKSERKLNFTCHAKLLPSAIMFNISKLQINV